MFEARNVAGSATYKQSMKLWSVSLTSLFSNDDNRACLGKKKISQEDLCLQIRISSPRLHSAPLTESD